MLCSSPLLYSYKLFFFGGAEPGRGGWIYEYLSFHFKVCFFGFFSIIFRFGFLFCYVWLNAYFDLLSKRLGVSQLKCLLCGWRSCKEYSKLKLKTRISFEESYIDKNLMIYLTVNVFLQHCAEEKRAIGKKEKKKRAIAAFLNAAKNMSYSHI